MREVRLALEVATAALAGSSAHLQGVQLGLHPGALRDYGKRDHTRTDHLKPVVKYLDWKTTARGSQALKELTQFLLDRVMEHDSPTLLFNLAREFLMSAQVVRPGPTVLAKMVGEARTGANALTTELLGHLLTAEIRADLERLLIVDVGLGMTGWSG
ncbi:DUF4158 domain-containing protein [Nonomuraea sp. NPDC049695]|uniref:DUF4158 domain-containing protein n=1 Tax=Nonomuraea sp. NPDC049695 TaxID=3154734 RepID=UPI003413BB26